jgi:16S rRNA (cytosine967-C5)-methyltransferase
MHPEQILAACTALVGQVIKFEHPADAVVSRFFKENRNLGPRERATLAETAYNVLRKKTLYDTFAMGAPKGSGSRERKLAILGFFGPRDYVKASLSDLEKNWLDACDATDPANPESGLLELHRHNLPEWLAQALKSQLSDVEFWQLVDSLSAPAPLDIRINAFKTKREAAQKDLSREGIKALPTPYSPWGLRVQGRPAVNKLKVFTEGNIEVQDEGSQLLAMLVDAKRGEMVVDFCAGAGGKTLALGAMMRSTGRLYAFDTSAHRLDALKPRVARSGLSNVQTAGIAHERDERVKRLAGKIDRVLVDAPCTGLGTLRRNPDLKWRQKPSDLAELHVKQAAILQSAARLLKPGGRLVYATCSVLPEENEAIAKAFSEANKDFTALECGPLLTQLKVEGADSLCSGPADAPALYLRLWPHRHTTDGFFAAVWQKNAA